MRSRKSRFCNGGFTLFEVLLALILLTVATLALSDAFSNGFFVAASSENDLVALNLAKEKIESLRNMAYSGIANESKAAVSGFSAYQREVVVATPQTNLKQVTVNVYWYNKSAELSVGLVTYVSNI
jgi:prepilin-type N-terminal cleavage/methylation domain-containing protein